MTMSAQQILDREFLETRAKVLEIAAAFDRLDRGSGAVDQDPRLRQLHAALQVVVGASADRAERVQLIFSRDYDQDWRKTFRLES